MDKVSTLTMLALVFGLCLFAITIAFVLGMRKPEAITYNSCDEEGLVAPISDEDLENAPSYEEYFTPELVGVESSWVDRPDDPKGRASSAGFGNLLLMYFNRVVNHYCKRQPLRLTSATDGESISIVRGVSAIYPDAQMYLPDVKPNEVICTKFPPLKGYNFFDVRFYEDHADLIKKALRLQQPNPTSFDVVIHIRTDDLSRIMGEGNIDYTPLPLSYYKNALKIMHDKIKAPMSVLLVYKPPSDDFSKEFVKVVNLACSQSGFVKDIFHDSVDAKGDFNQIMSARNLIGSVGTFAWTAAFLSENLETFVFPDFGVNSYRDRKLKNGRSDPLVPCFNLGIKYWTSTKVKLHSMNLNLRDSIRNVRDLYK